MMNQIMALFFNVIICAVLLMTSAKVIPEKKYDVINGMAFDMEGANGKPDDFVILDSKIPPLEDQTSDDSDEKQKELEELLWMLAEQGQDNSPLYDNQVLPPNDDKKEADFTIDHKSAQDRDNKERFPSKYFESFEKRSPEVDLLRKLRRLHQLNRAFNLHNQIRLSVHQQQARYK